MATSLARLATTATRYLLRSPASLRPVSALSWKSSLGPSLSLSQRLYSYSNSYSTTASAVNNFDAVLTDSAPLLEVETVSEDSGDQRKNSAPLDPTALPFSTLKSSVHANTFQALTEEPFKLDTMSHVQSKVLPLLPKLAHPYDPKDAERDSSPRDLLVKAKTGTGKTLAFLVPALEARLRAIDHHVQTRVTDAGMESDQSLESRARRSFVQSQVGTLVISPTRELATQIANEALRLTSHHQGFQVQLLVGGESRRGQVRDWERGRKDLVVATPGRLRDLVQSEKIFSDALKHTQLLVLDEADSLLDMGFRDDIEDIIRYLPPKPERQTFLFSATVSTAIQQVARATLDLNHKFINCVTEDDAPVHTKIKQYHTVLPSAADQLPHIVRLLAHEQLTNPGSSKTIVFLPTTKQTQLFTSLLREMKGSLPAGSNTQIYEIHSKRTMMSRQSTSADFRADKSGCSVLISSDVSARGVDYPGVTRVIQVGIPPTADQYVHRVGRTGRAGAAGRQGRGDLVLLPWEMDFVTWNLKDMPLKPVTAGELERQVCELAEELDGNPQGFFDTHGPKTDEDSSSSPSRSQRGFGVAGRRSMAPSGPKLFTTPYTTAVNEIGKRAELLREEVDEEAMDSIFMAMLGYYVGRTSELRMDRYGVMEACKQWAIEAGGMKNAPHVSETMLQRLGMARGSRSTFSPSSSSSRPSAGKFGMKQSYGNRDGRSGSYGSRDGRSSSYGSRDGQSSSYGSRDGQSSSYGSRDGRSSSYGNRDGRSSSYGNRDGRSSSYGNRDGIDRGKAQADWRGKERSIGRTERDSRGGTSWMSRGKRSDF